VTAVKTQRIFRKHFNIARHGSVPCRNTLQLWVENFRTNASALKNKPPSSVRTMRSSQKNEAVRQSFVWRPKRSVRRYSVVLGIFYHSVRIILRKDLNFHPFKVPAVQQLNDPDMAKHSTVAERLIGILSDDAIILMIDEAHFHLCGCANKQNFRCCAE
jgi:transposase